MKQPGPQPASGKKPRGLLFPPTRGGKALFIVLPFLLAGAGILLRRPLLALSAWMPPCPFYAMTGWYCPGCGNTRSVRALLSGDILLSLRYNIFPVLLILFAALWYIQQGTALFGRPRRLIPRSPAFWIPFGAALVGYLVIRNFFPLPL